MTLNVNIKERVRNGCFNKIAYMLYLAVYKLYIREMKKKREIIIIIKHSFKVI